MRNSRPLSRPALRRATNNRVESAERDPSKVVSLTPGLKYIPREKVETYVW